MLAPNEMLIELVVPPPGAHSGGQYLRHTPRRELDIAAWEVFAVAPDSANAKLAAQTIGAFYIPAMHAEQLEGALADRRVAGLRVGDVPVARSDLPAA